MMKIFKVLSVSNGERGTLEQVYYRFMPGVNCVAELQCDEEANTKTAVIIYARCKLCC